MTQLLPPRDLDGTVALLARTDFYVGAGEEAAATVALAEGTTMRFLGYDVRMNSWAGVLTLDAGTELGPFRLRGSLSSLTLQGAWRLSGCDWAAETGSWVALGVGAEHALAADAETGASILVWMEGTIEMLSSTGAPIDALDVFRALDLAAAGGVGVPPGLLL
jgi:hypothetical protein